MNEYLKEYIELQKQFRETKGNPDSVRALYTFKEELEQSEEQQAKEVLVYTISCITASFARFRMLFIFRTHAIGSSAFKASVIRQSEGFSVLGKNVTASLLFIIL